MKMKDVDNEKKTGVLELGLNTDEIQEEGEERQQLLKEKTDELHVEKSNQEAEEKKRKEETEGDTDHKNSQASSKNFVKRRHPGKKDKEKQDEEDISLRLYPKKGHQKRKKSSHDKS